MTSTDPHTNPAVETLDPRTADPLDPAGDSTPASVPTRGAGEHSMNSGGPRRRPGRPLEVSPDLVLRTIRHLTASKDGLFRAHLSAPGLYARARRLFGSWSAAVRLAGVDYETLQGVARARSLQTRRRNRRRGGDPR
jgi:hypothetical protein